ncbi:16190_t:CDS:10, partial [Cetraspora pellucida]
PNAIRTNLKQFTNAYILVYIRESDIDFVLSPVLDIDIPEHLQKRMDEEKALFEQKKKEIEECHFYLSVKIVTPSIFERYQGFDLANFDDRQYPLSELPQIKILKSETYGVLKTMVAQKVGIPSEQIRLWVLVNRVNKTVRPDTPITDDFLGMTMEEVRTKVAPRQNQLNLLLEASDKLINGKAWFPTMEENSPILVFIKYFNPDAQSLEGVCSLYVRKFGKDGDIICFQKALTEQQVQEHTAAGRIYDIPTFYESLVMRIMVQFKPKYKVRDQEPEFELILNKKYTYNEVAKRVAAFLNMDPLKLRFTTAHPTTGTYKAVIKSTAKQTLSEMLQTTDLPNSANLLYYETLDISIIELETKKFFKQAIDICLPKTAIIYEVHQVIGQKLAKAQIIRI